MLILKNSYKKTIFVFFTLIHSFLNAQNLKTNSLVDIEIDSITKSKIRFLIEKAWDLKDSIPDTSIIISKKALLIAQQKKWGIGIGRSLFNLGDFYWIKGEYLKSIDYYKKSLKVWDSLSFNKNERVNKYAKKAKVKTIGNMGNVYSDQGDFAKALEYYLKALKLCEQLTTSNNLSTVNEGKEGIAMWLGNIGGIYFSQENFEKALDYYFKALKAAEEAEDKNEIARLYGNIGSIYLSQKEFKNALSYFTKSLKMNEELGDKGGTAINLSNIGVNFEKQGNYSKALYFSLKALKIKQDIGDIGSSVINLGNVGLLYTKTGNFKQALIYLKQALALADTTQSLDYIKDAHQNLSIFYDSLNKPVLAYFHYKKYIIARDSIINEENQKNQIRTEMNYEFEKKELETKAEQDKKDDITKQEKQKQKLFLYFVASGLIIVLFFSFFLYKRYTIAQKQKKIIQEQKNLVDEHQKEILDSITYAKRLQEAILPPIDLIKKYLPNSFVLYKPKAIVAGDFYWMEAITINLTVNTHNTLIFIAAADCTGHGVPGAMVSVVCSNALNRSVKEFNLSDTGRVLDKTRELVLETFEKSTSDVKDGMDISLLCIDKKNYTVFWSGANNPLWYITPNTITEQDKIDENTLIEIKADKQPIGKTDYAKPFTTHQIKYIPNTTFYLFTDGLADQFGGPKGKKFKYKQFSDILLKNNNLSCEIQSQNINKEFLDWKGDLEQVDDVCVIGIKL